MAGLMFEMHGFSQREVEAMSEWRRSSRRSTATLAVHPAGYGTEYVFAQLEDWRISQAGLDLVTLALGMGGEVSSVDPSSRGG